MGAGNRIACINTFVSLYLRRLKLTRNLWVVDVWSMGLEV